MINENNLTQRQIVGKCTRFIWIKREMRQQKFCWASMHFCEFLVFILDAITVEKCVHNLKRHAMHPVFDGYNLFDSSFDLTNDSFFFLSLSDAEFESRVIACD